MENAYGAPHVRSMDEVPAGVLDYLNGHDLLSKTQALQLATVDLEGWPKNALLSAGDMLASPDGRFCFAIYSGSGTAANLERDGRFTLSMAVNGGVCTLGMRARKCSRGMADLPLSLFEAKVERVDLHVAPYASVTSGISFVLHDPPAVLARWQRQIAAFRSILDTGEQGSAALDPS